MHSFRIYVTGIVIFFIIGIVTTSRLHAQIDLQQLMQQGTQMEEPSGAIPTLQTDRDMIRISDTLPEGVQQILPTQSTILLDQTIDPGTYIIGPGDLFVVYLWGTLETNYLVRVSPEGYLIVPTVGSIRVADMTISQALDVFRRSIQESYDNIEFSMFLMEPRRFRLMVSGLVYVPGMHEAHALERVSDVLERAGLIVPAEVNLNEIEIGEETEATQPARTTITPSAPPSETEQEIAGLSEPSGQHAIGRTSPDQLSRTMPSPTRPPEQQYPVFSLGENRGSSMRTIRVYRNGEVIMADLLRFIKLGDLESNPYVNSGDQVEVAPYGGSMSIDGEVHDQGLYEFREGDRISDLVRFAGGLTAVADTARATLVRFGPDGRSLIEETVDLYDALTVDPDRARYSLRVGDRLYIRRKYDYNVFHDISLVGEVRYPGRYPIEKGETTITDVIRMAGGFTGHENLGEARLLRQVDFAAADIEYRRILELASEDRTNMDDNFLRSYLRTYPGSVNIDFKKLFGNYDISYDTVLEDGDIIYIPMKRELVSVMGAVKYPGYFRVEEGEDYRYYLEKAGGFNWDADRRNVYVYKAGTNQQHNVRRMKEVSVEGGDTILIFEKERLTFWQSFSQYSNVLTTAATLVVLALQVTRK